MTQVLRQVDRDEWRRLTALQRDMNYRQLWEFGVACAERIGACSEHIVIEDGGDPLGLADVRVKQAPLIGGVAYITGAPLVRRDADLATSQRGLDASLAALRDHYVRQRGLTLRILPAIGDEDWTARQVASFEQAGFVVTDAARPYHTMAVDLRPEEPEIRRSLAQKWRNCLNASERNGCTVTCGSEPGLFARFDAMFKDLRERKGFESDLGCDFYASVQAGLEPRERFLVTIIEVDGADAAGHVGHIAGDTCVYLLGASNDRARRTKAAYLAQWAFLLAGKAAGCSWYDLGGVDEEANPGVYRFKRGLGGASWSAPGPYEMRPHGLRGVTTTAAERTYRALQRLNRTRHRA